MATTALHVYCHTGGIASKLYVHLVLYMSVIYSTMLVAIFHFQGLRSDNGKAAHISYSRASYESS